MNDLARKLWYAITNRSRVAILDYPVNPFPLYTPETAPHKDLWELISKNNNDYRDLVKCSLRHKVNFKKITLSTSNDWVPAWKMAFYLL